MTVAAATWHGRRGPVLLGPTEHRVARWLADRTRHGRITIRTAVMAEALRLERSEAYRITARLRVLGLFGIENDRAGTHGGRRIWRTAVEHDIGALDPQAHRTAWSRVHAWARARQRRSAARLSALRSRPAADKPRPASTGRTPAEAAAATFAERMRRAGLGELMDTWGIST